MNIKISNAPLLAIAGLTLVFGQAFAGEIDVNCDEGDSLQKAIDSGAGSAARREIFVTGFCEEDLLISRDRISLLGDGNTVISGRIVVRGSDGLVFRDLSITGPGDGISASMSRIFMTNVHFNGNHGYGIALRHGGLIFLIGGSITDNQGDIGLLIENGHGELRNTDVFSNAVDGIVVNVNGSLTMTGGSVHENVTGIVAKKSSTVELGRVSVAGNHYRGIDVSMGSVATIDDSAINGNDETGLFLSENSYAEVGGGEIAYNGLYGAVTSSHSILSLDSTQVHDNHAHGVVVETDGGLFVEGTTVVDGNWADDQIECRGKEASMEIGDDAYVGSWACVDPDF